MSCNPCLATAGFINSPLIYPPSSQTPGVSSSPGPPPALSVTSALAYVSDTAVLRTASVILCNVQSVVFVSRCDAAVT